MVDVEEGAFRRCGIPQSRSSDSAPRIADFLHGLRIGLMALACRIEVRPQGAVSRMGRFFRLG